MSNRLTEDKRHLFYVAGGNDDFKEFYDVFYEFDVANPTTPRTLPSLPMKVSHHNLVQSKDGKIYCIGGLYEKQAGDNDNSFPGTISSDIWMFCPVEEKWSKVDAVLPKPRTNFECILNGTNIFIFAGDSGGGKGPSTQIDIFDTATNKISQASFRLPLGVSGASLAFFNQDVLIIGGDRMGKPSTGVMKLDFKDQTILSLRDLEKPRSNAVIINTTYDEMIAIGGSTERTVERRHWCPKNSDYIWSDFTSEVTGMELLGNPNEYNVIGSTFEISGSFDDPSNNMSPESNFIFGNELSPFMLEFNEKMQVSFFSAPLNLQQKTGQYAFRRDHNRIIFIGGTDSTFSVYSKKTFELNISQSSVNDIGRMGVARTGFSVVQSGSWLYATGGWTKGFQYLNNVERLNIDNAEDWEALAPMNKPRAGHLSWTCPDSGKVFVAGGVSAQNGEPLSCCEVYDPQNNTWTVHTNSLPTGLQGAATLNHQDGKRLIVVGGSTGSDPEATATNQVRLLDRSNFNGFEEQPAAIMGTKRYNPFAILGGNDDQIVVIGGTKEQIVDVFNYSTFKTYDQAKLQQINEEVFDNLDNFTNDLALYTCSGC